VVNRSRRLLIIGWDGADWEILEDLLSRGYLPNVAAMIRTGVKGVLNSTIPSHSWSAWSTFMTGLNPGRHGVYDFVERQPGQPQRRVPVSSTSIKAKTFFEILSDAGHEIRVGNVPVTFPPIAVRGRLIAGVAIPPRSKLVHPHSWERELLARAPFPINGMEWTRFAGSPDGLVSEVEEFVEKRTRSFEVLLEGDWRVAVCVYVAPDRLQHPFAAHLMPSHPDHEELGETPLAHSIRTVYQKLDAALGRLCTVAGDDAAVVLMSDHGFRPMNRTWNLGAVLNLLGYAASSRGASATSKVLRSTIVAAVAKRRVGQAMKRLVKAPTTIDWAHTVAYQSALGFGVSLNLRGREPEGIIHPDDRERVLDEVTHALLEFRSEDTNETPIGGVTRREELYDGPYVDLAPDLIVGSSKMWGFERMEQPTGWSSWPSGTHRLPGVLISWGGEVAGAELKTHSINDIAPTALAFCGCALPPLDGQPIPEICGSDTPIAAPTRAGSTSIAAGRDELTRDEEKSISDHLRSLGYIE
jgi:predicted AlkP superfamily phosphohydrolase/phosphomutase